jgi:hypothetical protein
MFLPVVTGGSLKRPGFTKLLSKSDAMPKCYGYDVMGDLHKRDDENRNKHQHTTLPSRNTYCHIARYYVEPADTDKSIISLS